MALTKPTRHGRHQHTPAPRPPDIEPEPLDEEDEIQQLCQELNDAGYTAEISWGQVVVSPWMNQTRHRRAIRLMGSGGSGR
ncbi:hypothetical protein [Planotetraspora sp. GP83]|uniref:hypothetical protein n=1 Tax=Planotetraspora sp. GP83 TaxID=3156264 RepID=UPI0035184D7F